MFCSQPKKYATLTNRKTIQKKEKRNEKYEKFTEH